MRAKNLKLPEKKKEVKDFEADIPKSWKPVWYLGKWFIKACIAIPFIGAATQCAKGFM